MAWPRVKGGPNNRAGGGQTDRGHPGTRPRDPRVRGRREGRPIDPSYRDETGHAARSRVRGQHGGGGQTDPAARVRDESSTSTKSTASNAAPVTAGSVRSAARCWSMGDHRAEVARRDRATIEGFAEDDGSTLQAVQPRARGVQSTPPNHGRCPDPIRLADAHGAPSVGASRSRLDR